MPKKTISQAEVKPTQEQQAPEGPHKAEQVIIPPSKSATQQQQKPRDDEKTASSSSTSGADLKAQKSQEETPSQRPVVDSQKTGKELTMAIPAAAPEKKPDGMTQKVQEETEPKPTIKLDQGKVEDEKSQKVQQEIEPKPKLVMSPRNNATDEKPQKKGQEDTEPKPISEMVPGKPLHEKPETNQEGTNQSATLTSVPGNQSGEKTEEKRGEDAEKERISNKEIIEGKPSQSIKAGNGAKEKGMVTEKEIRERRELPKTDGPIPKIPQEERNLNDDMIDAIGKGIKEVTSSASQAFTRIAGGKWDDEDKPLLLNMGASILVLAAVGIYALYRFSSS